MQLMRLQDITVGPNDRVYRHAPLRALIGWLLEVGAMAACFYYAYARKFPPGYFFGAFLVLFVLLTRRMVTARFHPSNWLVRMNDSGIYIQYRSYLNYELPPEEPTVVFIDLGEIASARMVKERVETPDPMKPGVRQTQYLRHIELELSGEIKGLGEALDTERSEPAPEEKHWYGKSSTLYRDYPVSVSAPNAIRIHWDVSPGIKAFLEALRPYTAIGEPVSSTQDFTQMKSLGSDQQKEKLRELVARGQMITAISEARRLNGGTLAEAKDMVEALDRK